jgi:hypothetical protein
VRKTALHRCQHKIRRSGHLRKTKDKYWIAFFGTFEREIGHNTWFEHGSTGAQPYTQNTKSYDSDVYFSIQLVLGLITNEWARQLAGDRWRYGSCLVW